MNYEGKKIPKNLNEFTIVDVSDPISQGNTGTCWCFSTTSFYESEDQKESLENINLLNFIQLILNISKKQEHILKVEEKHI